MVALSKKIYLVFLFLLILGGCSGGELDGESQNIQDILEKLTTNEMSGRLTGTEGNDLAVKLIEEKYKEIGLQTTQDEGYLIEYPHKFYDPEKQVFELKITTEKGEISLQRGVDFLERSILTNYNANYPLTFDINDSQLENSYIVLDNKAEFQKVFGKAKGILIQEEEFTKTLTVDNFEIPIIQISKETYKKLKKIDKGQIEVNSSAEYSSIPAYNVVGKIPGKDHKNAIILSAHLDHVGTVNDTIYHGAIDNASGISILLDVAERLSDADVEFEKDIIIVAFNGEESGLQGSYFYSEYIKEEYVNVYNINFDSIYNGPIEIVSGDDEAVVELINDLHLFFKENDLSSAIDTSGRSTSDHSSFLHHHMNAVSIGSQNVMNKIHLPLDTISEINIPFLSKVSNSITHFLIENDSKLYEHVHSESTTSTVNENELEALEKIRNQEIQNLEYDEYKLHEYEKKKAVLLVHPSYIFKDTQKFNQYYPEVKYQESIGNYTLANVGVRNRLSNGINSSNLEINKVYKMKVELDDLQNIILNYKSESKNEDTIEISITKKDKDSDEDHAHEHETVDKEIIIDQETYVLTFDSEQNNIMYVTYMQEVNDQLYTVIIRKGEEVTMEIFGNMEKVIKSTIVESEVERFIQDYKFKKTVEETLKSL